MVEGERRKTVAEASEMREEPYDAVVIGGGPGGSSAATYLAASGRRVLLLEKEFFPRFHIGESLLPYNRALFDEMGVTPALLAAGFIKKYGAQFHIGNGTKSVFFVFRNGRFTRQTEAFQVERATFDHVLLRHAATSGAEVREGWTVNRFARAADGLTVHAADPDGREHSIRSRFLIDASGRANLTGNQEQIRVMHPNLRKLAIFGHFRGVRLDAGETSGDTVIVRLDRKWFWIIPISSVRVSVGCVMDQAEFVQSGETPGEIFPRVWKASAIMRSRMEAAEALMPVQTTSDFSYRNKRFVSDRLLRVGDAAGFMDPIFSAGVYLAMYSGKLAAEAVGRALQDGTDGERPLRAYEKRVQGAMRLYWKMVEHFYTTPFLEVFFEPRERFQMASAVNAALAGELAGGWRLRCRLWLFFQIVRIQTRYGLLPRILFNEP